MTTRIVLITDGIATPRPDRQPSPGDRRSTVESCRDRGQAECGRSGERERQHHPVVAVEQPTGHETECGEAEPRRDENVGA